MTDSIMRRIFKGPGLFVAALLGGGLFIFGTGGCANYKSNAPLYSQNVQLHNKNAALESTIQRQNHTIAELKAQLASHTKRIPTLPPKRLSELFTVSAVRVTSDTAVAHLKNSHSLNGFRVFVRTLMPGNLVLPATGTFTIEAFDLGIAHGSQRIGQWVFTPRQSKQLWYGNFGLNEFCFNCPWKKPPVNHSITFHLTFKDALPGLVFTDQRVIKIKVLPSVEPAAAK